MTTVIDVHGHVSAPAELYFYNYMLIAGRGDFGQGKVNISDEAVASQCKRHIECLDARQVDIQLIAPRPWALPSGERDPKLIGWAGAAQNDYVARQVAAAPNRFRGVGVVPVTGGQPVERALDEVQRCMDVLGFVGMMVNPDPGNGDGLTPGMGDQYWYPLYEKLEALDAPAMIHTGSNRNGRETQHEHFITEESIAVLSILRSTVFKDFPKLKLVVAHGGGYVPYQVGRFLGGHEYDASKLSPQDTFIDGLRRFYFDTCLYTPETLELLLKVVGPDRCLFGTDTPSANSVTAGTGRPIDDLKPVIDSLDCLSTYDRSNIFENNAKNLYSRLQIPHSAVRA